MSIEGVIILRKVAIVDIGSNTVRLVIYLVSHGYKYDVVENNKESVRLRNYVKDNILTDEGIDKLRKVLRVFTAIIDKDDITEVKYFATQTIRMVDNQSEILAMMKQEFDIEIEVFNEEKESLTGFKGMNTFMVHEDEGLYVDLGGGSMEIVYFKDDEAIDFYCFDFGSIVLRNMIEHAIPTDDEIAYLNAFLYSKFEQVPWLRNLRKPLIVVGGSSRNMVRIDKFITRRKEETHGYRIQLREINRIRKILMLLTIEEIQHIEGFTTTRADIIIPSIYVFETLYKYINADYYVCSRTALREGVLVDMIGG
jgi:exopolyphosphatase/guanosine-5'-triphosphate,3'-diphosphate pyrophosphatase